MGVTVLGIQHRVALRKESVDRNDVIRPAIDVFLVALRKESVDRNHHAKKKSTRQAVALRKESVDRNIQTLVLHMVHLTVALRKESVDRNFHVRDSTSTLPRSLSARRAWIEIFCVMYH